MKLVSYSTTDTPERLGLILEGQLYDVADGGSRLALDVPDTILPLLQQGERAMDACRKIEESCKSDHISPLPPGSYRLLAPVPHPPTCRDGYAFRQHVATARRNRGADMIKEFDEFPIFYFTNHHSIVGEGEVVVEIDHLQKLDFELEAAIVIGKGGRNIRSKDADSYIAGFTIMNDFSARVLQMEEMLLSLGPAKGKDFATAIGPWLVTPDELAAHKKDTPFGATYDLRMTALHNGKQISDGNMRDMNWTFAEIIERASYGVDLYPGDVIGSGTVGTGCYLELNGTRALEAKAKDTQFTPVWLNDGDTITLEIAGLGRLTSRIVKASGDYSILAKKKIAK